MTALEKKWRVEHKLLSDWIVLNENLSLLAAQAIMSRLLKSEPEGKFRIRTGKQT